MKKYLIITVILLVLSNIYWLYKTIDFGITYSYQQVTVEDQAEQLKILGNLLVEGAENYTKKDLLVTLRKQNPEAFIVEEKNGISINGISFIYNGNKLVTIE